MKLTRLVKTCLNCVCPECFRNRKQLQQVGDRRSYSAGKWNKNVCGTKRVLVVLFLLTIITNLSFRVVSFSDYYRISISNDDFHRPCVLPILNPFDPAMLRWSKKLEPLKCDAGRDIVFIDDDNRLQFNNSLLQTLKLSVEQVICKCRGVIRIDNDDWTKFSDPFPCKPPYDHKADFFRITCVAKSNTLFDRVMFKMHRKQTYGATTNNFYNVLMFGIDTVSRSSSVRNLKKTVKYLKDELGAFDFKGHMKTGDNTYPNFINIFTGLKDSGKEELPLKDQTKEFFDDVPFIWKDFAAQNYTTLFAEDLPFLSAFNLRKKGFKQSPVDHYMRPYWLAWHDISPMRDYKNGISLDLINVDVLKKGLEQYLCAGNVPNYVAHMQYVKRFFDTYRNERKFAIPFLVEISHNNQNILALADEAIYDFFVGLKSAGHLNNTIVIFFSDHGPKTGETFYTARMERSLPMLYIALPQKLKISYPNIVTNLARNTKKLTSQFDLYPTLKDIVERRYSFPGKLIKKDRIRGYSLFGPMPPTRSCAEAGVPEHFCACYTSENISLEGNSYVNNLGLAVTDKLNALLSEESGCAKLSLNKVLQADHVSESQKAFYRSSINVVRPRAENDLRQKYTVVIETVPGNGHFLATCIQRKGEPLEVLSDIDRVNRYNNQSYCIDKHKLRPLCYCKVQ